ncbi:hypothetical protein RRG08_053073 [Elysia crispata]|uniref:Apple domain-containing protein n=1 Tax=Elysia crispata TaxID=231223 RepID=A0AAE1CLQ5_9GAST|nr:hypothetical protein RRG08_053073 [Elysia crispata]
MPVSFLILVAMVGIHGADCVLTPFNLWPLTNISFAWDVITEKDASHPDKNHCPTSLVAGPTNFNFLSFLFDRTADSYVRVTTADDGDGFSAVTLAFLLYLESLTSGLILEYKNTKADEGLALTPTVTSPDALDGIVLELQSGTPHARIYNGDSNLLTSVTSSVALTPSTWTWVAVRWDGDTGDLSVQVGAVTTEEPLPEGSSSSTPLVVRKGDIQLGQYLTHGAHISFSGRLCCLALFKSIVDPVKSSTVRCMDDMYVKSGCSQSVISSDPSILHLWPLSNTSFGYDVINTIAPHAPADYQCSRSNAEDTVTNRPVVYMDASQLSYLDFNVAHAIFQETMLSFQVFLQPKDPVEGVVWDYCLPPGRSGVGFQRMTLTLETGIPTVSFFDEFGQCGSVINREAILPNIWTLIYLVFSTSSSKLVIQTLTEDSMASSSSGRVTCSSATNKPPTRGVLTVGSLSDTSLQRGSRSVGFRGNIACLTIFNQNTDRLTAFKNLQRQCTNLDNLELSEDPDECSRSPPMRERKFVKAAVDKQPQQQDPLACYPAASLIVCSYRCRHGALCRAFSYCPDQAECCLYDYVTEAGLEEQIGTFYYTVSRI